MAKLYAYWIVVNYREAYQMFAANGILFNHESPRRGETFVTRKITRSVAKIQLGELDCFELGNLDAQRDWGHARDYVQAMWLMLQQPSAEDFVIATGQCHSVREFVELAFRHIGKEIRCVRPVDADGSSIRRRSSRFLLISFIENAGGAGPA